MKIINKEEEMKESSYEKREKNHVISLGARFMCLMFLFTFQFINSQVNWDSFDLEKFDSFFTTIDSPIVVDDISVRYSENTLIPYEIIREYTMDDFGEPAITITNEKIINFYALGKIVLNENIVFYIFSMESNFPEETVYSAYVALYEDGFFETLYYVYHSSDIYRLMENKGTYIDKHHWVEFNIDTKELFHIQFDKEGNWGRSHDSISIDVKRIKRVNPFTVKFNRDFYSRTKVLMPWDWVNNFRPGGSLSRTGGIDLTRESSYFVGYLIGDNDYSTIYFMNLSTGGDLICYEIMEKRYREDRLQRYGNISHYCENPDGKFYLDYSELNNKTSEKFNRK